ncbi:MAG: lysophospholipid acyltransferase family protein, partial [Calditrichota bacterium]
MPPRKNIVTAPREKLVSLRPAQTRGLGPKAMSVLGGVLDQALLLNRMDRLYAGATGRGSPQQFFDALIESLGLSYAVREQDLAKIPTAGPVVVVSNHPFGLVDPIVLAAIMLRVRSDIKVLTNRFLSKVSDLSEMCIFVDPFGKKESLANNIKPMKETVRWLNGGGMVIIFPAGEVASANLKQWKVVEPPWSETVARIIRMSKATVVPVFFRGTNTPLFHAAGFIHPRLRTALLPREMFTKRGHTIELAVGNGIPWRRLADYDRDQELIQHLRERTFLLRTRTKRRRPATNGTRKRWIGLEPIAPAAPEEVIAAEIKSLPTDRKLISLGELEVYFAAASEIPEVLKEIGRLREITFRVVGEGTGHALDLDEFDRYYLHLFLWNAERRELVGAYRMGPTDEIIKQYGLRGLYTTTLFQIKPALIERIDPALELGRSFVRTEYQRTSAALALLWKGLAMYVVREPRYRILFGPVSISNDYHKVSHQLMVSFLKLHSFLRDEAKLVRARHAFRARRGKGWTLRLSRLITGDIDRVSDLVSDIEGDDKGVPVLI